MSKPAISVDAAAWLDGSGQPISCSEKIRILNESLNETLTAAQAALDDAVLMGCSAEHYRATLEARLLALRPTVKERTA